MIGTWNDFQIYQFIQKAVCNRDLGVAFGVRYYILSASLTSDQLIRLD